MKALVLCGGRGTRLDADAEKPLYEIGGQPMIDRVVEALAAGDVDAIHAAVSPHAPRTREHLASDSTAGEAIDAAPDVEVVETPGDGYVEDLETALDVVGRPVLTVAADLPLLAPEHVRDAIAASDAGARSLTVCVPAALKRLLGATCEREFRGGRSSEASVDSGDDADSGNDAGPGDGAGSGDDAGTDGERSASGGVAPTGLNVVGPTDAAGSTLRTYDARLAVNVNTVSDARIAEVLL